MNMKMTKARALQIQAEHVDHYASIYGDKVRSIVSAATNADALTEGEHDIFVINRYIPRGGAIEALIPEKAEREAAHQARMRQPLPETKRRKGIY
jgi:hypothetical protein